MPADGTAVRLVSRCSSVEEFLSAFRTFVHVDHVFVPTTDQVTPGRRARMAITLADGTPMLAGDAEVLSSSTVPQGPHQRAGIRLRFVTLDDAAREVMTRMEQARSEGGALLAELWSGGSARTNIQVGPDEAPQDPTQAAVCTVVEASAPQQELPPMDRFDLTPTPSPTPPTRTAPRMTALGPAVAPISPPRPATPALGTVPGKSFKIPQIPAMPGRGRASTPPAGIVPPAVPAVPVIAPPTPVSGVPVAPEVSGPVSGDLTIPTDPTFQDVSIPILVAPAVAPAATPGGKARNKAHAAHPTVRGRASEILGGDGLLWSAEGVGAVPVVATSEAVTAPVVEASPVMMPSEAETAPMAEVPAIVEPVAAIVEPVAAIVEPVAAIVDDSVDVDFVDAAMPEPEPEPIAESKPEPDPTPTSIEAAPPPPPARAFTRTLLGVAAIPMPTAALNDDEWTVPEDGLIGEATERSIDPAPEDPANPLDHDHEDTTQSTTPPSTPMAAPLSAPSWQVTPASPATLPPWKPLGATAPAPGPFSLPSTPPGASVAATAPAATFTQPAFAPPPPPPPVPASAPRAFATPAPVPPPPIALQAQSLLTPPPVAPLPPAPAEPVIAPFSPPMPDPDDAVPRARDAEPTELVYDRRRDEREDTDVIALRRRQRRPLIIAAVALAVVAIAVIAVLASGGGGKTAGKGTGSGSDVAVTKGSDRGTGSANGTGTGTASGTGTGTGTAAATTTDAGAGTVIDAEPEVEDAPDAGVETPDPLPKIQDPPVGTDGLCAVAFSSAPKGAIVSVGGKKVGTTPVTAQLPCAKTSASFARVRYATVTRSVVPKAGATTKVTARLERPTFTIKVTSTPSGAAVTVKGSKVGKTPVSVKVDGFEAVTVSIHKPGYKIKTTQVTAKKNGTSVKVALTRGN